VFIRIIINNHFFFIVLGFGGQMNYEVKKKYKKLQPFLKFLDVHTYLLTCAIASLRGLPKAK
jgi:hypothetical protein